MKVFKLAAFTSDLPDDQIEDENDIIQFGGQGVSRVIAQVLREEGYEVEEPEHLEHLGWEFTVTKGHALALRLSDLGKFFTLTSMPGPFRRAPQEPRHFNETVLRTVTNGLNRDGRFHDTLWFAEIGDEHGFTDPVVDAPGSQKLRAPTAWDWESWKA